MCGRRARAWYSGTSVRDGTAIWTSSTLSRHSGFSSRNFSKASSFCGMPLIMSSRSTPSITCADRQMRRPEHERGISLLLHRCIAQGVKHPRHAP